jgi:hypothetical protein
MCTCGTCSYSSVTLVVRQKSLRSILSPCNVYLWDPFSIRSVGPKPMGPVSMSIRPMGSGVSFVLVDPSPSDLWDPTASFSISIRPVGPDGLCVRCTYETIRPSGFNKFKLKKTMRPGSRTRDSEQGIDHLHHCARRLVVLTCLWSSICSLCRQVDLYIGYIPIPCKWKQICAR